MRGWFAYELYQQMKKNKDVCLVTGDLGYKLWDKIKEDFPNRTFNVGAAEQSMMGIAVGLALEGKIPFVYSQSTFLLFRPFETIRLYVNREKVPVRMIGCGRGKDYKSEGFTHWIVDDEDKKIMKIFKNIDARWPETKEEMPDLVKELVEVDKPYYINLKR